MTQQEEINLIYKQLSDNGWTLLNIISTELKSHYLIIGQKYGFGLINTPMLIELKNKEVYFVFNNSEVDWEQRNNKSA